jgi:hypothetical protein
MTPQDKTKRFLHQEIENMANEIKHSSQGSRGFFEKEGNEKVGYTNPSSFPEWYSRVKFKNKDHLYKVAQSGKGKKYEQLVKEAHDRLMHGYSNPQGWNLPDEDYLQHLHSHGIIDSQTYSDKMDEIMSHQPKQSTNDDDLPDFMKNEEMPKLKKQTPHLLFTTQKPRHIKVKHYGNDDVIQALKKHGIKAIPVRGKYGKEEHGIMVLNPPMHKIASLLNFVRDLGQDSALYSDGENHELHMLNGESAGQHYRGQGTNFFKFKPDDYWTTTDHKHYFSHNIDFNELYPYEHSKLNTVSQKDWKSKDVNPPQYLEEEEDLGKNEQFANRPKVTLNPEHGKKIADAFHEMKHDPNHPEVQAAYNALISETKQQYRDMIAQGFRFTPMTSVNQENPYKNSKDLHADIENNKHLHYFPTHLGFGSEGEAPKDHPMLQETEFKDINGNTMLANDIFRQVHDYRGHYLGGKTNFGEKGEHLAYLQHKKDFSPLAQKALATETMGQNQWVHHGPFGQHNKTNPAQTRYADQKAGLLPDEIIHGKWHGEE